jgi:lysozyme family protein
MANYKLILPSVAKFEGGLSSDPKDSCSKKPSDVIDPKTGLGYHTNKGVCYSTWLSASKKLGFDSSGKAFVNMTQSQWESIVKDLYWNPLNLDKVLTTLPPYDKETGVICLDPELNVIVPGNIFNAP